MPTKDDIKRKLQPHRDQETGKLVPGIPANQVSTNFMNMLAKKTGRNVIAYYSSFPAEDYGYDSMVNSMDVSGFMKCLHKMDCSKGLDLLLQTPGGDPTAAEGIVEYLQAKFHGDVRIIVPYMAMSAGTLISCSAKTIIMGKHSFLGPVDPQLGSVACLNVIKEFDQAREDIMVNPESAPYWHIRLNGFNPGIYMICKDAVALGDELVSKWLKKYMFAGEEGKDLDNKIRRIYRKLNSNNNSHGRHFSYEFCKELGLKVEELEADPEIQDLVLSIHHAMEITVSQNQLAKLIMNQDGTHYAVAGGQQG